MFGALTELISRESHPQPVTIARILVSLSKEKNLFHYRRVFGTILSVALLVARWG